MTTLTTELWLAQTDPDIGGDFGTGGLQEWIQGNIVPLMFFGIAVLMLWAGGRGDNRRIANSGPGVVLGLFALGIAVTGQGPSLGTWLAGLMTG